MKFDLIKNVVSSLAPTLGHALGGPLGGTAAKALASVLGCDPEPKALQKAVQNASPEQLAKIAAADNEFAVQMKKLDVDVFALEVQDTQNARKSFAGDWTPKVLALLAFIFFGAYVSVVTLMPDTNESIVNLVLGYLGGIVSAVVSFYFGASNKSESQ